MFTYKRITQQTNNSLFQKLQGITVSTNAKVICQAMKLLAYLFIYKAKRLPLFGKFMEMHIQTEERNRESRRVIGNKHLDIDNHFYFPNYLPRSSSNNYTTIPS